MNTMVSREIAKKVLEVVDAGLVSGKGKPIPGQMCVEAAVCYAMGLPHSDEPKCVGEAVRVFKIRLNDSKWPTDADRTKGMRKLAIAQLGSDTIDQMAFAKHVALECQRRVLPLALRRAASFKGPFAERLEAAAVVFESATTLAEADSATRAARALTKESRADDYADDYADAYAYANANAKDFLLQVLNLTAEIGLEALIACKSPGCEWLDLCDETVEA
jgi:hypothetical protein